MNSMTRNEAWQKLVNLGGIIEESSIRSLDYLVVRNDSFISGLESNKDTEIIKAEQNQLRGFPIQIIPENFCVEFAKDV